MTQDPRIRACLCPPAQPPGSTEALLTCSPVSGLITVSWSKLKAPFSSCRRKVNARGLGDSVPGQNLSDSEGSGRESNPQSSVMPTTFSDPSAVRDHPRTSLGPRQGRDHPKLYGESLSRAVEEIPSVCQQAAFPHVLLVLPLAANMALPTMPSIFHSHLLERALSTNTHHQWEKRRLRDQEPRLGSAGVTSVLLRY